MHTENAFESTIRAHADRVGAQLCAQDDAWGTGGWTRRRFLAGVGMAGVAAMGTQLATTRAAYAATPSTSDRTLIVIFMRGAADGLRIVQPNTADLGLDYLKQVRSGLTLGDANLVGLSGGWGLNAKLKPLYDQLWATGELAFVPGCSQGGISRSHFQAQQWLEKGGSDTSSTGWLERTLEALGPGTTFRAVAEGSARPVALAGAEPSLTMNAIGDFKFPGGDSLAPTAQQALLSLYRGVGGPLGADVPTTISALSTADTIRAQAATSVTYPSGSFGTQLKNLAQILRAEVGMQVATVDVGGWDTHTDEVGDLDNNLDYTARTLKAFMDDLGVERRKRVTVAVMTEFGRRVAMNASGGTDHGHGSLMWLLGGGLAGSGVYGKWTPLAANTLDSGDVPGVNNPFDVLGELVQKRLNVGSLSDVFVGYQPNQLGVATAG
ncbi:Uncharacterized conserved protein, DUF1501 family [Jatrophihabitans endophyticus]|uniref:Uncharacterized conserved protein, DUF1501 family n=1 Tax=Jatrophihabitans endophyticus TaxID=1206085 RepID=A0A1M5TU79_9ACTN|nr:DUF1501 domain-containing protein [Jatrophihabitans endophyticus]SHH54375.1 Uncharacterized conserved protein, DUF1501 family [Jatrophihabitans endophyticus]